MEKRNNFLDKLIKHPIALSFILSFFIALFRLDFTSSFRNDFFLMLFSLALDAIVLIHPFVLTACNLFFLFFGKQYKLPKGKARQLECLTFIEGVLLTTLLLSWTSITLSDWDVVLHNSQLHIPIWSHALPTIIVIAVVALLCYCFLSWTNIQETPPLVSVCAISGIYLGMILCLLWIIQIFFIDLTTLYLCLFPFNLILLGAKCIRLKILEWDMELLEEPKGFKNQTLNRLNLRLSKAKSWPIAAFLLMWPLLGIIICILLLFGQQADSIIKAWTETGDWNLSTRESPQNIYYDEHYLCTVAAGGHAKVVKPIRMGERHGHRVIVNRQLCIANAFEQILEERVPHLHKAVRNFYDTYGFPVAKLVKSPFVADFIYIIMKPLEWFFLIVIYLCDQKPENRIAVQYMPKRTM